VYLPKADVWYDFWSGKAFASGWRKDVPAPYDTIPVFVRSGSIVPIGPPIQYIGEKVQNPIHLFVYAGSDGSFIFYEDQGTDMGYKSGLFAEIPLHWDDRRRLLRVGERKGSFPGMLNRRKFLVTLVSESQVHGTLDQRAPAQTVNYNGKAVVVQLP
jgi:alpha-D-xyloside xylohydrolase